MAVTYHRIKCALQADKGGHMPDIGNVHGQAGLGGLDLTPPDSGSQTQTPSGGSSIKKSEKELIEELIAMLPKSWVDPVLATQLWQNLDLNLGLAGIANGDRVSLFSTAQSSIVLGVLTSWGKSLAAQAETLQEDIAREKSNPLVSALKNFVHSSGRGTSSDSIDFVQLLRSSPTILSSLQSALQTVDTHLLMQAYKIAEQKIILAILEKWTEMTEKITDQYREDQWARIHHTKMNSSIIESYLEDVAAGKQTLAQPELSIAMAGSIGGQAMQLGLLLDPETGKVRLNPAKESIMPVGLSPLVASFDDISPNLPPDMRETLHLICAQLLVNTSSASAYWNIPGAVTIASSFPIDETGSSITKAAARAYAFTISGFVFRPEFETFVTSAILKNLDKSHLPGGHLEKYIATMKILLLTNALGAVDKTETGGVIIRGADLAALLSGTGMPPLDPDDHRIGLVRDINTLLATLPNKGEALKGELIAYFDSNPDVDAMIDPAKAIIALADPRFFRHAVLTNTGG